MRTFNRDSDEIYGKNFKITMREDNLSFLWDMPLLLGYFGRTTQEAPKFPGNYRLGLEN